MNVSIGRHGNFAEGHLKQNGAALIIFFLVLILASSVVLFSILDSDSVKIERDKKTVAVLAEAKAALIGYAAGVSLSPAGPRPGDLPCPDNHSSGSLEGTSSTPCSANALGRLPWKTLGLSDLRDDSGERLWYAVSTNFKNSPRTTCTSPGQTGCLNSDTNGTITVRNTSGTIVNNGSDSSAAIAVVIAPGSPLTRQDGLVQDRSSGNYNTASHYLDNTASEDNSNFVDGGTNGFVSGIVENTSQEIIVNDKLIAISYSNLMPLVEKRVANEVLYCLKNYAASNPGGSGRHPWSTNGAGAYSSFIDSTNHRLGRIPDTSFTRTQSDSSSLMSSSWTGSCKIVSGSGWWFNWKDLVFYAVAYNRDPANTFPVPACSTNGPNGCLTVITPSVTYTNDQKAAVIVAGKALSGQSRTTTAQKQSLSNYLEGTNAASTASTRNADGENAFFEQKSATSTFNDVVVFY